MSIAHSPSDGHSLPTDDIGKRVRHIHQAYSHEPHVDEWAAFALTGDDPELQTPIVRMSGQTDDYDHTNSIDESEVTDEERATLLREYCEAIKLVCPDPLLLPLDDTSKKPAFVKRSGSITPLDSQTRAELHTSDEAVRAIRNGSPGFALYYGREDFGTEDLCCSDHDDTDIFPRSDLPETLTVMSGSGGYHQLYRTDGSIENGSGKDEYTGAGEIKQHNVQTKVPGSIHDDGGVYHVSHVNEIATLSHDDIPIQLQKTETRSNVGTGSERAQTSRSYNGTIDVTLTPRDELNTVTYTNANGETLDDCREYDNKLNDLLTESYPKWAIDSDSKNPYDDSQMEAKLVNRLYNHWFTYQQIADICRYYRYDLRDDQRWKLNHEEYINRTLTDCTTEVYHHGETPHVAHVPSVDTVTDAVADCDKSPITWENANERLTETLTEKLESGTATLVDALCGLGKSRSILQSTATANIPITIFTERHTLFDQYVRWAQDEGLDILKLPSVHGDCDTMNGEHGTLAQREMSKLYERGFTPSDIHKYFDLPCCNGDDRCPYRRKWDFDSEDYDVLVGHYKHAYNPTVTDGRVVVIDEFPKDAYETTYSDATRQQIVSTFCNQNSDFPFEDCMDIIENKNNSLKQEQGRIWLRKEGIGYDPDSARDSDAIHPLGSVLTYGTLMSKNLGNGFNGCLIEGHTQEYRFAYNRPDENSPNEISLLNTPSFNDANGLICLDGTPQPELWNILTDTDLEHVQVLSDSERTEYLTHSDCRYVVRTTEKAKSYSSGTYNTPEESEALYKHVAYEYPNPPLLTTMTVRDEYDTKGITDIVGNTEHYYGNVNGSNELQEESVAIIDGSPHYGDDYIKKWNAWFEQSVERVTQPNGKITKGMSTGQTTELGNAVLQQMRESQVTQSLFRPGRDESIDETVVYVNTAALPEWIPIVIDGHITPLSDGLHQIIKHVYALDKHKLTTKEITNGVTLPRQKVTDYLNDLVEYGYMTATREPGESTIWEPTNEFTILTQTIAQH